MRTLLENEKKTLWYKPLKIFYPEDLLIEILNKTKDADLLSYEQFLASNSHVIVIICESAGSLVELGAFTISYLKDIVDEECDLSVRAGVLMERLKAYEPNSENLTEKQKEVLGIWNNLSTNELETVMSMLRGLRK